MRDSVLTKATCLDKPAVKNRPTDTRAWTVNTSLQKFELGQFGQAAVADRQLVDGDRRRDSRRDGRRDCLGTARVVLLRV